MRIAKPTTSKAQEDGLYLAMLESVKETVSKQNPNAKQLELLFTLNNRQKTRVWANMTEKGIRLLMDVGIARDADDGELEITESNHLVGIVVTRGKGVLTPATTIVKMNPALEPLFKQVSIRASFA